MLLLNRRVGESIKLGRDLEITVTVIRQCGSSVVIGIDAPRNIPVHREEIAEIIQGEEG